jgi:hypothetical protein
VRGARFFVVAFALCSGCEFNRAGSVPDVVNDPLWPPIGAGGACSATMRRPINLPGGVVSEALSNFPLFLRLEKGTDIDYALAGQSAERLRFYDAAGQQRLPYELDHWNPDGRSLVWVRAPRLDPNGGLLMWMYYGEGAPPDPLPASQVWSSDYVAVWHMNDGGGIVHDSTAFANDGTLDGNATIEPGGRIGTALILDGNNSYLQVAANSPLDITAGTVEALARFDGLVNAPFATIIEHARNQPGWYGLWKKGGMPRWLTRVGNQTRDFNATMTQNNWFYVAATIDVAGNGATYQNGAVDQTFTINAPVASAGTVRIGANNDGNEAFLGALDEVRVSRVTRSPGWIDAQYLSMNSILVTIGPEQKAPCPP